MKYIALDTCVWIDLCDGKSEELTALESLVRRRQVVLLVPTLVLEEWDRNRGKITEKRLAEMRRRIETAKGLAGRLDGSDRVEYERLVSIIQSDADAKAASIDQDVLKADSLLRHSFSVPVQIPDEVRVVASRLAQAKKAPFIRGNGMGDALIFLSVVHHKKTNQLPDCTFVSSNVNDFGAVDDRTSLHSDLRPFSDEVGLSFSVNAAELINELRAASVSAERVKQVQRDIDRRFLFDAIDISSIMENIMPKPIDYADLLPAFSVAKSLDLGIDTPFTAARDIMAASVMAMADSIQFPSTKDIWAEVIGRIASESLARTNLWANFESTSQVMPPVDFDNTRDDLLTPKGEPETSTQEKPIVEQDASDEEAHESPSGNSVAGYAEPPAAT